MHGRSNRLRKHRWSAKSETYLITTVTYRRTELFDQPALARIATDSLRFFDDRGIVHSFAWVVMPDHVHWLFKLRHGELSKVMLRFKNWTGRCINQQRGCLGMQVWQRGYQDRYIRNYNALCAAVRYVISNPVEAGIVVDPDEYPYSFIGELDPEWEA